MTAEEYKAARRLRGTQAEVAKMLGVTRLTVARRETNALRINTEAVLALQIIPIRKSPPSQRKPHA